MSFYYASWRTGELIIAGVVGGLISYFGINYMNNTKIVNQISIVSAMMFNDSTTQFSLTL